MNEHILDQSVIDNHKVLLITAIIDCFLKIRMNHIGKSMTIDLQKKTGSSTEHGTYTLSRPINTNFFTIFRYLVNK